MEKTIKIIAIGDIHGKACELEKLSLEMKKHDAVFFAGDFSDKDEESSGIDVLKKMHAIHDTVFAVSGDSDAKDFLESNDDSISVENSIVSFEGLCISGCGGTFGDGSEVLNFRDEEEMINDLHLVSDEEDENWDNLIVISHTPPKGTECDISENGMHEGSELLSNFIEKTQPLLVITGHAHKSQACCKMGNTTIINPGALCDGKYASLEITLEDGKWCVENAKLMSL